MFIVVLFQKLKIHKYLLHQNIPIITAYRTHRQNMILFRYQNCFSSIRKEEVTNERMVIKNFMYSLGEVVASLAFNDYDSKCKRQMLVYGTSANAIRH